MYLPRLPVPWPPSSLNHPFAFRHALPGLARGLPVAPSQRLQEDKTLILRSRREHSVEAGRIIGMLLPIHVAAGGLAIVLGAAALLASKGGTIHRRSGLLFVSAMLVMGVTGSILAFRKSPSDPNVLGGFTTVYFVGTALATVRPVSPWTRSANVAALAIALGLAIVDVVLGMKAFHHPRGLLNGVPFLIYFFLATIIILAAIGDARSLLFGPPRGGPRLTRHLWRMCFALFIAVGSFFSIRARVAKVLPEPFTTAPMRVLPILLVFAAMFYWLWKVRRRTSVVRPTAGE